MDHHHSADSAGRDFIETCACGAIRPVGNETWYVKEENLWELWDLYFEKFQVRAEGDPRK